MNAQCSDPCAPSAKKLVIFNADPTPHKFAFLDADNLVEVLENESQIPTDIAQWSLLMLDTNDVNNIGQVSTLVLPRVHDCFIIDHHEQEEDSLAENLILKSASSTAEILYQIIRAMNVTVDFLTAQALFTAIVYDTGSFIYPKTTALTFEIARDLVAAGVEPNLVYAKVYESNSISALVLQSRVLSTLELAFNDHVAILRLDKAMILESGASYEESDQLINIPLKSEDIRVSVFFKENLEGLLRCSLRSKGNIDVAEIAQAFGGGGHKTAAGFKCPRAPRSDQNDRSRKIKDLFPVRTHRFPSLIRGTMLLASCALVAGASLLFVGCRRAGAGGVAHIVPKPLGDSATAQPAQASAADTGDTTVARPRIAVDPGDTVLQVLNVNLDNDPDQEQVIALKRTDDVTSPVRIVVADSDPARGTYYYQSWQADTDATDTRLFSLSVKDLVGDHTNQIVVRGMNDDGKVTLDIYHPLPPSQGKGIEFRQVCQLVADVITVDESDRPDDFASQKGNGVSFPVTALLRDPDSQNVLDLVQIRYTWSPSEARYVPGPAEKKAGEEVQQAQLKSLFTTSGEAAFEQFLSGSWVQVQTSPNAKNADTNLSILDFDAQAREISFSSGSTVEKYSWRESFRQLANKILIIGENEAVSQIALMRSFTVEVESLTSINVSIAETDTGVVDTITMKFSKITEDLRAQLIERADSHVNLSPLHVTGRFAGSDGMSLAFDSPSVTWSDKGGVRTGSYTFFALGTKTILSIRFPASGRGQDVIQSWRVDYHERKDATRTHGPSLSHR